MKQKRKNYYRLAFRYQYDSLTISIRRPSSVSYDSLQTDFLIDNVSAHPLDACNKSGKEMVTYARRNESIDWSAFGMQSSDRRIEW